MKPDTLLVANDGNFTLVVPKHPVLRFMSYASAVVGVLLGPALILVITLVGELHVLTIIGGVAILLTTGSWGIRSAISTARMQRRVLRLRARGLPATAQVVGTKSVSLGEETGTQLTLRISGTHVPMFRTTYRGKGSAFEDRGDAFAVVVDPKDNAWLIVE
jgi:hypothetical protein